MFVIFISIHNSQFHMAVLVSRTEEINKIMKSQLIMLTGVAYWQDLKWWIANIIKKAWVIVLMSEISIKKRFTIISSANLSFEVKNLKPFFRRCFINKDCFLLNYFLWKSFNIVLETSAVSKKKITEKNSHESIKSWNWWQKVCIYSWISYCIRALKKSFITGFSRLDFSWLK